MGKVILRLAQIIGGLACVFFGGTFIVIGIGGLFSDDPSMSDPQLFYIELLPNLILIFSTILWFIIFNIKRKYKVGGIWLIGFGILFFCSMIITKFIRTQDLTESIRAGAVGGLMYAPPLFLSGILYLIAAKSYESSDEC